MNIMKMGKKLRGLKNRSTICCLMRKCIRNKDLELIGCSREIKTQSFFMLRPQQEREQNLGGAG